MPSVLVAFLIAVLMIAVCVGSIIDRPNTRVSNERIANTESQFSKQFGFWREASQGYEEVVNPQTKKLFDLIYRKTLVRIYVIADRYFIMQNGNHG